MKKNILIFLTIISFLVTACTSLKYSGKRSNIEQPSKNFLLPTDVVPTKYDLTLWVSTTKDYFSGQVTIHLDVKKDRDQVMLHAEGLEILSVSLKDDHGERPGKFSNLGDNGLIQLEFSEPLKKGHYQVEMNYRGKYQEDLSGLYRVKEGNDYYFYTQFEPLSARKMLPCFDEPKWKTPFLVKVVTDLEKTVIANSLLDTSFIQGEEEVHIFKTTKPISPYLLALAIGPFDVVKGPALPGNEYRTQSIEFRGISVKGKGHKLAYALKEAPQILNKIEQYFRTPYPYDKLDILAVPDFKAGAMENVGAITFNEWYLLLNEDAASVDQRRGFYLVMAHELAHQWFGNLVTMPWWDDLWLNEAFATWLSYKIVNELRPEFRTASYLLEKSHNAMSQDSLKAARRIREPINSAHDIHNAFDGITYSKGAAVLSMWENYLGQDRFRDAITFHIKRFQHQTASSSDFLQSLAHYSDARLVASAETFLNQTGVPQVSFALSCNKRGALLSLEQKRFLPLGSKNGDAQLWKIPMCIGYESHGTLKKHCLMLDKKTLTLELEQENCPLFILPNFNGQGYYRFSMSQDAWTNLIDHSLNLLSETDRITLADGLLGGLHSGMLPFSFAIEGLRKMVDGKSSVLARYFIRLIKEAKDHWVLNDTSLILEDYAYQALKESYAFLREQAKLSDDEKVLKNELTKFLVHTIKDKNVRFDLSIIGDMFIDELINKKNTEKYSSTIEDESLMGDAVAIALHYQDDNYVDKIATQLETLGDTVARGHLLYGLAHSREGEKADKVRSLIFNKGLRKNEQLRLFYDHLENQGNQPATWSYLKTNIESLKLNLSKAQLAHLPHFAEGLCSYESAMEVKQFLGPMIADYEGGPRNLAAMAERIELCAARKRHASLHANTFLKAYLKSTNF